MNEELTKTQADDLLEQIAEYNAQIKAAEAERDEFKEHYEKKIAVAENLCKQKCEPMRQEIAVLTETLRRYAAENLPEGRQSLKLPSGKLKFRKQSPKFYDADDCEVSSKSKALMTLVKSNFPQYVQVKTEESVAWSLLKPNLSIEGEKVYYTDEETGEVIPVEGLRGRILPDTFTIEIA